MHHWTLVRIRAQRRTASKHEVRSIRQRPGREMIPAYCAVGQPFFVNNTAEQDHWRQKYFDGLARLETEQAHFKALETTLKRLAGRLCTAALGQSPQLDEQLRKLQTAMRRETSGDELEKITPALTDAIQALDHSPTRTSTPATNVTHVTPSIAQETQAQKPALDEKQVRSILSALLIELRRDIELAIQVDALDSRLEQALTAEELPRILSEVADVIGQRISRIERAKHEIEALLSHMVGKLDEIGHFVAEQDRSQHASRANSETLNTQLVVEMKAMGESVDAARDLQQIRAQVRGRLESIDRRLQEFRQRETELTAAANARNEQMRSRIAELEAEATRLQTQLIDEQRLASIDALTRIPNRHAYERRIEEELQRWRRFGHPTCLAVWDVDRFKHINDTYGHRAGDRVLQTVADCLSRRIRTTDFLARFGGEEFVMVLSGTQLDDALRLIDDMRESVAKIGFHFRGTPVSVTISIGVTAIRAGDSADVAFDRADKALYKAKENGRDRCQAI